MQLTHVCVCVFMYIPMSLSSTFVMGTIIRVGQYLNTFLCIYLRIYTYLNIYAFKYDIQINYIVKSKYSYCDVECLPITRQLMSRAQNKY